MSFGRAVPDRKVAAKKHSRVHPCSKTHAVQMCSCFVYLFLYCYIFFFGGGGGGGGMGVNEGLCSCCCWFLENKLGSKFARERLVEHVSMKENVTIAYHRQTHCIKRKRE